MVFRYDGGTNFQELSEANSTPGLDVTAELIRAGGLGGGIGSVLYRDRRMALVMGPLQYPVEHFVYDGQGNTVAIVDSAGAVIQATLYDAFGNVATQTQTTSDNNRLRNTKERSAALGLDNDGFRYYNPETGRYVSRDPLGYKDGLNPYLSVHNNPINKVDPLGLSAAPAGWTTGPLPEWAKDSSPDPRNGFVRAATAEETSHENRRIGELQLKSNLTAPEQAELHSLDIAYRNKGSFWAGLWEIGHEVAPDIAAAYVGMSSRAAPRQVMLGMKRPRPQSNPSTGAAERGEPAITREAYAALRKKTPSQAIRDMVNPEGPKFDPVYNIEVQRLEADHIVPMKEVVEMRNFTRMTEESQVEVLNLPENFMGLSKASNASKGAKDWSEWQGHSTLGPIPDSIRAQMLDRANQARAALERAIDARVSK